MNKVKSRITGVEISLAEYFNNLTKSFIEENDGEEVTVDDIKLWCDNDDAFEAAELVDGEPTAEYMAEYDTLYRQYINECKEHFEID